MGKGLDVGGYEERPDWPKLGPSLLIATCLMLAIRTARWPAVRKESFSSTELEQEIEYCIHVARRVLSSLLSHDGTIFPRRREPWYEPNGDDQPK